MFTFLDRIPIDVSVAVGTGLLGGVAGVIGSFAVLRRRSLIGDVLAHAALPGLCIAFVIVGSLQLVPMLLGGLASGLLGVGCITLICRWTRTKEDAAMGMVLGTFFGLGSMLVRMIQNSDYGGAQAGIDSFLFGSAAGITRRDVAMIAVVAGAALLVLWACYKEFQLFSFDPGFARSLGWPIGVLDIAMMGTLATVAMIGLPAVGVVMTAAMLIIPGATARFWVNRLGPLLLLSAVVGSSAAVGGTLISSGLLTDLLGFDPLAFGTSPGRGLPPGPVIVLCGTALFLFSMFLAPRRGIVAVAAGVMSLRSKTARENLLRRLYELSEPALPERPGIERARVLEILGWSAARGRWQLARAARRGMVELAGGAVCLTAEGLARAVDVTRAHRLWELFLIEGVRIAPDHVDRDADAVEHLLPAEVVARLEKRLAPARGAARIPESPHALDERP